MKKYLFFLMLISFPVFSADIETSKVLLQAMDKVTGRVKKLEFNVGDSIRFGELTVVAEKCFTKPPEETPENAAFLRIFPTKTPETEVFKGWMFSSNPALSAMEDPVYDIWVVSCFNPEVQPYLESEQIINQEETFIEIPDDPNEPIED